MTHRAGSLAALATAALVAAALLMLPLRMPIGPMYWDLVVYVDAAHRMSLGQVPNLDFFAPVGPLAYALYAALGGAFAGGHPLLVAQWSAGLVTLPIMAGVLATMRGAPWMRWTLLGVFLAFALLPFNTRTFSAFPGAEGFGIYNRHGAELLFVVAAVLLFARGRWVLPLLIAVAMLAAFWLKVTAFVAAGMLCLAALLTGRVRLADAATAGGLFLAVLALVELAAGLTSAYVGDLITLAAMNGEGLAARMVQAGSVWIGVLLPAGALLALLAVSRRGRDDALVWGAAALAAGLLYESQNTGSQGFIHLWPVAIAFAPGLSLAGWKARAAALLAAASLLPPLVTTIASAVRAHGGQVRHVAIAAEAIGPLARVTAKPQTLARAQAMAAHYAAERPAYAALAGSGWLPGPDSYAEHDYQLLQLMEAARAVEAVRSLEAERGIRFGSVMALNFVNPYAAALGRSAPRHVSVGADPSRTVPAPDAATMDAVRATDLVLRPICPVTSANQGLHRLYAAALGGHRRFRITRCTEAWTHPRFGSLNASALSGSPSRS